MRRLLAGLAAAGLALAGPGGCAHAPTGLAPGETALPPIPEARGELSLYVAYPDSLDPVFAADSNFVFGTTGSGAAELTVNGRRVRVEPNGSFLAWLPVPEPTAGDTAAYRLVARAGGRADTLLHRFRVPLLAERNRPRVWADTASAGAPERWALPGERVSLSLRGAPGLDASLLVCRSPWWAAGSDTAAVDRPSGRPEAPEAEAGPGCSTGGGPAAGRRRPGPEPVSLRLPVTEAGSGRYRAAASALELLTGLRPGGTADRAAGWTLPPEEGLGGAGSRAGFLGGDTLELRWRLAGREDTVRVRGRMPLRVLDPRRPPTGRLREAPHPVHGLAGAVPGRPSPHGSYAWLFPSGSRAPVAGREGDRVRLRLGEGLEAWAAAGDVTLGPVEPRSADAPVPAAGVGTVTGEAMEDRVRIRIPVGRRLPAHVAPAGARTLEVVVHGGLGETGRMRYPPGGDLVRGLAWEQRPGPRYVLRVELDRPVWGWDLRWEDVSPAGPSGPDGGEDAGTDRRSEGAPTGSRETLEPGPGVLVLDLRRPPDLGPDDPLEGLRVAVDPGHPPVGAEGPTGLTEAEANLSVARRLARRLREAGAEPVLVRRDSGAVGLYERRRRARAAGAHLLVSIHNNALPDGVRPFGRAGTSTYYFHRHARELARHVQRGMLATMGLRDRGVRWGNLALPRESWMPSVLTEGAFMMIPRHEAALRTRAFQQAYADGVLTGIRRWLEERAREGR